LIKLNVQWKLIIDYAKNSFINKNPFNCTSIS